MRRFTLNCGLLLLAMMPQNRVKADFLRQVRFTPPLSSMQLTSGFGVRQHPISKALRHHDGIDLAAPVGTPIRAVFGGVVAYAGRYKGYGKLVVLLHPDGKTSHYAHCSSFEVQVGEIVRKGELIARVGESGAATGPHLHFEIRRYGEPVDPARYIIGGKKGL